MLMHNHPHPGEAVKDTLINGAELSVTEAAHLLSITRASLSNLINCHTGISPQMAVRLSICLNTSSDMWLNLQTNYDLWKAEKGRKKLSREVLPIKKFAGGKY